MKAYLILQLVLVLVCRADHIQDSMMTEMQSVMDTASAMTGYSFSVGYVDVYGRDFGLGSGPRSPPGSPSPVPGNVSSIDTMLLGSGSKPFTAAGIMRLVDQGKLSLDDLAAPYIDKIITPLNGTTLVGLFGPKAANITVGNLIFMQSGVNDFDIPSFDNYILKNGNHTHSLMEYLYLVGSFNGPEGCEDYNCTFVCEPGTCTCYSSTSYILAGLVLLSFYQPQDWTVFDQFVTLGLSQADFPHLHFANHNPMNTMGLTTAGGSVQYGSSELYQQDASILGWTCGNVAASGRDAARFYHQLLSPHGSIVSKKSLAVMEHWHVLSFGWAEGYLSYGAGLMVQNVNSKYERTPAPLNDTGTYFGHGGDTYAFMSDNGFYPALNATIVVIVNSDEDFAFPSSVTCLIASIAEKYLLKTNDIVCRPIPVPKFSCQVMYGEKVCAVSYSGNQSKTDCLASCK